MTIENNIVAENNVNTRMTLLSSLPSGIYTLKVSHSNRVINTITLNHQKMAGSGTEADPYVITNATHLNNIRDDLDAYYILDNDIDLTDATRAGGVFYDESSLGIGGFGWNPINNFSGTLDGQGHTIKGLYQNSHLESSRFTDTRFTVGGLFGVLTDAVEIKNLVLENFEIYCHGMCGILAARYTVNDLEIPALNFENIAIKNSKITQSGYTGDLSFNTHYAAGFIGFLSLTDKMKLNLNNIFIDVDINAKGFKETGFVSCNLGAKEINMKNIQILGNYINEPQVGAGLLSSGLISDQSNIEKIFAAVYSENIEGSLFNDVWVRNKEGSYLNIKNVNILNLPNAPLLGDTTNSNRNLENTLTLTNVNLYDLGVNSNELSKAKNYADWTNFSEYWNMNAVNGVNRYPVLKIASVENTEVENIRIVQELNKNYNIYDYVNSERKSTLVVKSNDESIVKVDNAGNLIPIKDGTTTIYVESLADGYNKNVPIRIDYKNHYTVHFDANGGTGEMPSIEVSTDDNYVIKTNSFTKELYDFVGWNTKPDGSGLYYADGGLLPALKDNEEITLYAQWKGQRYKLTFDPDGGQVDITSKNVRYNEPYGELPIPVKAGFGFEKWNIYYDSWVITAEPNKLAYPAEYSNAKAIWKEGYYNIIFNPNGAEGYITHMLVKNNINTNLDINPYVKEGYTFAGWNTKSDGSGTNYEDGQIINQNKNVTLYAQWKIKTFTITFDANGGVGQMNNQVFNYNEPKTLSSNLYTKENYIFIHWNTKADGSGKNYSDKEVLSLTEDITLYAIWAEEPSYVISTYAVDIENKYIDKIPYGTTLSEFAKNIQLKNGLTIEAEYKVVNGEEVLYTGGKTKIYNNGNIYDEFTNIVRGDVNGNGKIDIIDYIRIRKDIMKTELLKDVYSKAADVNENDKIDIIDYIRIKKIIMD